MDVKDYEICSECLHRLCNMTAAILGYYELLEMRDEKDTVVMKKLGVSIDNLHQFVLGAGDIHRKRLLNIKESS